MDETTAVFSIGNPRPVTDSRQLPAVSADEEAAFLGGLVGGDDQPDGAPTATDEPATDEPAGDEPAADEAELAAVVEGLATDGADESGFDDSDVVELEVQLDPVLETALGLDPAPADATAGSL